MKKYCIKCGSKLIIGKNHLFNENTGEPIPNECSKIGCPEYCKANGHKREYKNIKNLFGNRCIVIGCNRCGMKHKCLMSNPNDCMFQ